MPALYLSLNGSNQPFRPSREGSAGRNEVLGIKETRAPKLPLWYHGFRGQRTEKDDHDGELSRKRSHLALAPLMNEDGYSGSTPSSAESKASGGKAGASWAFETLLPSCKAITGNTRLHLE